LVLTGLVIIYGYYNPVESGYFPKCIFHSLTGLKCPSCGSQRAIHDLIHFQISSALKQNALMVTSIPYLSFLVFYRRNNLLQGKKTIYIILVIIIMWTILRNIQF